MHELGSALVTPSPSAVNQQLLGPPDERTLSFFSRTSSGATQIALTCGYTNGPTSVDHCSLLLTQPSDTVTLKVWLGSHFYTTGDTESAGQFGDADYGAQFRLEEFSAGGGVTTVQHGFSPANEFQLPSLGGYAPKLTTDGLPMDCAGAAILWDDGHYFAVWAFGLFMVDELRDTRYDGDNTVEILDASGNTYTTFGNSGGNQGLLWAVPNYPQVFTGGTYVQTVHRAAQPDEGA